MDHIKLRYPPRNIKFSCVNEEETIVFLWNFHFLLIGWRFIDLMITYT